MSHRIAPSILAANFLQLQTDIELINESAADWIHFDVMDGQFVPNISFGLPILKAIRPIATKPIDVHLMIEKPANFIHQFADAGADVLTVHVEACQHLDRTLRQIQELGMMAGVALNPATPVETIQHVIPFVDVVLLMSVNPGFGGQSFLPYVLDKAQGLKKMIQQMKSKAVIEVDGGIDLSTAPLALAAGIEVLVAGSFVFKHEEPRSAISQLKQLDYTSKLT